MKDRNSDVRKFVCSAKKCNAKIILKKDNNDIILMMTHNHLNKSTKVVTIEQEVIEKCLQVISTRPKDIICAIGTKLKGKELIDEIYTEHCPLSFIYIYHC